MLLLSLIHKTQSFLKLKSYFTIYNSSTHSVPSVENRNRFKIQVYNSGVKVEHFVCYFTVWQTLVGTIYRRRLRDSEPVLDLDRQTLSADKLIICE